MGHDAFRVGRAVPTRRRVVQRGWQGLPALPVACPNAQTSLSLPINLLWAEEPWSGAGLSFLSDYGEVRIAGLASREELPAWRENGAALSRRICR